MYYSQLFYKPVHPVLDATRNIYPDVSDGLGREPVVTDRSHNFRWFRASLERSYRNHPAGK